MVSIYVDNNHQICYIESVERRENKRVPDERCHARQARKAIRMSISINGSTSHGNSTTRVSERDACILGLLDRLHGMFVRFSRVYTLEYDECVQHASLIMLETWDRIPAEADAEAYLNGAVRRSLYQLLKQQMDYNVPLSPKFGPKKRPWRGEQSCAKAELRAR